VKLTPIELEAPIEECLREAEILPARNSKPTREISQLLELNGAGLNKLASQISDLASHGHDESIRLRANELALKAHGVLEKDAGHKEIPQIVFIGADQSIIQVLMPR
jgi:hypothetical protein